MPVTLNKNQLARHRFVTPDLDQKMLKVKSHFGGIDMPLGKSVDLQCYSGLQTCLPVLNASRDANAQPRGLKSNALTTSPHRQRSDVKTGQKILHYKVTLSLLRKC